MGAMRARLTMKLISIAVMLVLTVITARSCSGHDNPSSPLNPASVLSNGLSGLCANQQAEAAASGSGTDGSAQTLPVAAADPGLMQAAGSAGLPAGAFTCPTTTTTAPGY